MSSNRKTRSILICILLAATILPTSVFAQAELSDSQLLRAYEQMEAKCCATNNLKEKARYLKTMLQLYEVSLNRPEIEDILTGEDEMCGCLLDDQLTYIAIEPEDPMIKIGDTVQLTASIVQEPGCDSACKCNEDICVLEGGSIRWINQNDSVASMDENGLVTAHKVGETTFIAVTEEINTMLPDMGFVSGQVTVTVVESSAVDIVFVAQGDNNSTDWMGFTYYDCPTEMCLGYPCWYIMYENMYWWGWHTPDLVGETYHGKAAVDDPDVIGISLSEEGPFVSGPIDVTWTVEEDGRLWCDKIFIKPLGEGSAYIYHCWSTINGELCDPFAWPSPSPMHFRTGPYEVSPSIVPIYDYIGMRDIGDQVVASLNEHFDDYRFRLITYGTHPDQSECNCLDMWPGYEPYLEPDLFHEWVPLTNDPVEISGGLNSMRPFCDSPTNSEYRRFRTPYSNTLRAIENTPWREGAQRVVILLQFNSVDHGDFSVTVEPITGVTPEMVINAAISHQVSLYTTTDRTMWVNGPLIEMAESTNGKYYYIGDYRPPWDSWVFGLFNAILDDISSQFSTSNVLSDGIEIYDNSSGNEKVEKLFTDGSISQYIPASMEPTVTSNPSFEDFETGNLDKFNWISYSYGGIETDWMVTTDGANSGSLGARAGFILDGQQSNLEVTLDCTGGDISFYRKVSSEDGYDYLKFYIDGLEKAAWSGNEDWSMESYPVKAGRRTFQWVYSKDDSVTDGYDTAWIDDIVFPISEFMAPATIWYRPARPPLPVWDRAYLNENLCVNFNAVIEYSESWLREGP